MAERTPVYSPRARKLVELAVHEAENQQENEAGTEHLLLAMLKETDCVATRLLYTMGVNIQKLYTALLNAMGIENLDKSYDFFIATDHRIQSSL